MERKIYPTTALPEVPYGQQGDSIVKEIVNMWWKDGKLTPRDGYISTPLWSIAGKKVEKAIMFSDKILYFMDDSSMYAQKGGGIFFPGTVEYNNQQVFDHTNPGSSNTQYNNCAPVQITGSYSDSPRSIVFFYGTTPPPGNLIGAKVFMKGFREFVIEDVYYAENPPYNGYYFSIDVGDANIIPDQGYDLMLPTFSSGDMLYYNTKKWGIVYLIAFSTLGLTKNFVVNQNLVLCGESGVDGWMIEDSSSWPDANPNALDVTALNYYAAKIPPRIGLYPSRRWFYENTEINVHDGYKIKAVIRPITENGQLCQLKKDDLSIATNGVSPSNFITATTNGQYCFASRRAKIQFEIETGPGSNKYIKLTPILDVGGPPPDSLTAMVSYIKDHIVPTRNGQIFINATDGTPYYDVFFGASGGFVQIYIPSGEVRSGSEDLGYPIEYVQKCEKFHLGEGVMAELPKQGDPISRIEQIITVTAKKLVGSPIKMEIPNSHVIVFDKNYYGPAIMLCNKQSLSYYNGGSSFRKIKNIGGGLFCEYFASMLFVGNITEREDHPSKDRYYSFIAQNTGSLISKSSRQTASCYFPTTSDAGKKVFLKGNIPDGPAVEGVSYYIINPTGTTFQISATSSGSAISFTGSSDGFEVIMSEEGLKEYPSSFKHSAIGDISNFDVTSGAGYYMLAASSDEITGLAKLNDRLYVFKKNTISEVSFTGNPDVPIIVSEGKFSFGGTSVHSINDTIYYYNSEKGICAFDGISETIISTGFTNYAKTFGGFDAVPFKGVGVAFFIKSKQKILVYSNGKWSTYLSFSKQTEYTPYGGDTSIITTEKVNGAVIESGFSSPVWESKELMFLGGTKNSPNSVICSPSEYHSLKGTDAIRVFSMLYGDIQNFYAGRSYADIAYCPTLLSSNNLIGYGFTCKVTLQCTDEPSNLQKRIKKITINGLQKGSRLINPIDGQQIVIPEINSISDINRMFSPFYPPYGGLFLFCAIMNRETVSVSDDVFIFPHESISGYKMNNATFYPDFSSQKPMVTIMFKMQDTIDSSRMAKDPIINDFQKEIALSDIVVEYEILGESPRR